jgi:hypothetical protein
VSDPGSPVILSREAPVILSREDGEGSRTAKAEIPRSARDDGGKGRDDKAFRELGIIAAVWAAAILLIHPRGDFPIVDDWDFAIATWNFARSGHFQFTNFTAVSLRAMVLWGAAWTRLFGESFEVLRASTLVLSLGTLLVVNRTLARGGVGRGVRIFTTLALLFHPLFLWASCTYMTDVPFVFASAVALYCFTVALLEDKTGWLLAGCLAVMVAWFIRQNGVFLLISPLVLVVWRRESRWRAQAATLLSFLGMFALLLLFKREWLAGSPAMFATHFHVWTEETFRLPEQVATLFRYVLFNAQNSALFFLPLTLPLVACLRRMRKLDAVLLVVLGAVVVYRVTDLGLAGYLVPYNSDHLYSDILPGNFFIDFGLGVPMLIDTFSRHLPYPFTLAKWGRVVLTGLSALATALMLWALLRSQLRPQPRSRFVELAALAAAFGTLVLFGSGYYYDRYSLDTAWPVCLALPLLVPWDKRLARALGGLALACMAVFSTLAVQEHFIWQRARWTAWHDLRARGIAVDQIDGGAEAGGLYELATASVSVARRGHGPRRYAITFRPLDGYRVIARYPFTTFLGGRRGAIYTIEQVTREQVTGTSSSTSPG